MSSSASDAAPRADRRRGRWIALALFVFVALPVAGAFLAYFFWTPQGGVNYGELIEPRGLPDVPLTAPDGSTWRLSSLQGSWVLVQIGSGKCGEPCVKRHFAMRQARLMTGREMARVQRVWLVADDAKPDAKLLEAYEGVRVGLGAKELLKSFPADDPRRHVFLIDPLGNLMLRFPDDPDAKSMSKDLARLLRVSHVG